MDMWHKYNKHYKINNNWLKPHTAWDQYCSLLTGITWYCFLLSPVDLSTNLFEIKNVVGSFLAADLINDRRHSWQDSFLSTTKTQFCRRFSWDTTSFGHWGADCTALARTYIRIVTFWHDGQIRRYWRGERTTEFRHTVLNSSCC